MKVSQFGFLLSLSLLLFNLCPSTWAEMNEKEKMEMENKKIVLSFIQEFFGDKNFDAVDKYICPHKYIQHNPGLADGRETLKSAAKEWFKNQSKVKMDIKRVAADGDLVWIHMKSTQGMKGVSVVDIFRLEQGKIVEHWDVIQEIPEKSANSNTMF